MTLWLAEALSIYLGRPATWKAALSDSKIQRFRVAQGIFCGLLTLIKRKHNLLSVVERAALLLTDAQVRLLSNLRWYCICYYYYRALLCDYYSITIFFCLLLYYAMLWTFHLTTLLTCFTKL